MEVILALERATTTGTTADRYAAGIFRFQLGSSARFNDLMHAAMSRLKFLHDTTEAPMWQTKTETIDNNAKIIPLISPNHSFTGIQWWKNLEDIVKNILEDPQFKNADYLLATPDRTRTRILPQPITYSKALTWLRAILHNQQVNITYINKTTLHSLRLWMAEAAFQQDLPREQRRYIGRWANENTADVYTRDHRVVINRIWKQVTNTLKSLPMTVDIEVPTETNDSYYKLEEVQESVHASDLDPGVPELPNNNNIPTIDKYPKSKGGPLSLTLNKLATGKIYTRKVHFVKTDGQTVGCGYYPKIENVTPITNADDWKREFEGNPNVAICKDCNRFARLPDDWTTTCSASSSGSSETSDSDNDTASEEEALKLI